MTYYGSKEMAASFRIVRNNTIRIAEEIPEDRYGFRPAANTRTVGELLVHIAFGPTFQFDVHSRKVDDLKTVNFPDLMRRLAAEEATTRSKAEILELLTTKGDAFASFLESFPESFLSEQVTMPPGADPATKSRFEMLLSAKEHEMHHRAQLMTIQRMLGLVPHLTREMQERMAKRAAAASSAR